MVTLHSTVAHSHHVDGKQCERDQPGITVEKAFTFAGDGVTVTFAGDGVTNVHKRAKFVYHKRAQYQQGR